jgi:hypothetical protein
MMESDEIIKWLGTIFIVISALLVSVRVQWSSAWWAYVGFAVGHVIWAFSAWFLQEWALFWLNIFFIFVDSYAIHIRINNKTGEKDGRSITQNG